MMLKERVMDPRSKDDISEALAYMEHPKDGTGHPTGPSFRVVPSYVFHWYPDKLKERTVGPHSRDIVGMSRFYPTLDPKVVVDFEPAPPDKFFEQEKRRFCMEQRIVYIPIYLLDRMNEAQFKERYTAEREAMEAGIRELNDDKALAQHTVEGWMLEPQLMVLIDRHVLQLVEKDERENQKRYYGISRAHVLRRYKNELLNEVRSRLRIAPGADGAIRDPIAYLQKKVDAHAVVDPVGQSSEPASAAAR